MLNFSRSTFTWKSHPWQPDPHYKWAGGFVGQPGEVYHVRFNLEARCHITEEASGQSAELFLGAPCRSEYTIARRNLFQIPSTEWRMAFSRNCSVPIAKDPSTQTEATAPTPLAEQFADFAIDIRTYPQTEDLADVPQIVAATFDNALLNAASTYRDPRGFAVTVEYPVHLININADPPQFQICTGPVLLPDLATWDGAEVHRVFVADVAISDFDWVEFILRRQVEAAPEERAWLDRPRGRDRYELRDPANPPTGNPPDRPKPLVFNEVWEFDATNTVTRAVD